MKKILLLSVAALAANLAFAQSSLSLNPGSQPSVSFQPEITSAIVKQKSNNSNAKSTGVSDTLYRVNQAQYDSLFSTPRYYWLGATLPLDSGLVFGTNAPNWTGFASRYRFGHMPDTTFQVIGILAVFNGRYTPNTTKSINFHCWGLDTSSVTLTPTRKLKNRPGTSLAMLTRSIKTLGINITGPDTIREYFFPTAATGINTDFYVGYEMSYQWSNLANDTFGVYSCAEAIGWNHGQILNVVGTDTFISAQTTVKDAGVWKDTYMQLGFNKLNISIVPIFQYVGSNVTTSVSGITQNNLTFFGHYPNPATEKINIKFGLSESTTVSVMVRDISGKTVVNIPANSYGAGEHTIQLEVAELPAGNYVYMVRTAEGNAMAAQLTVIK